LIEFKSYFFFFVAGAVPGGATSLEVKPIELFGPSGIGAAIAVFGLAAAESTEESEPPQPTRRTSAEQTRKVLNVFMLKI